MSGLKPYAGVARAPFLVLPFTLIASGAAAAAYAGHFRWIHTAVGLVGLVALHIAVNVFNEYSDMVRTGIDLETKRTPFSGGSGTLPSGALSQRAALWFGVAAAAVGLLVGVWFVFRIGWQLLPLFAAGAVCVLAYTDVMTRIGLGELGAGLGLGALPVVGIAQVQEGATPVEAVAVAIPAFLMTFDLLLLNEFPDEAADRKGGRRNLVLMLGRAFAAKVYALAAILVPISIVGATVVGFLPKLALIGAVPSLIFLVKPLQWALVKPLEEAPLPALGANVIWNLATNTMLAIALTVAKILETPPA